MWETRKNTSFGDIILLQKDINSVAKVTFQSLELILTVSQLVISWIMENKAFSNICLFLCVGWISWRIYMFKRQHNIYKHLNHWSNIHLNLISFNVNWMRLGTGVSDADDPHPMMRIGSERRIIVASMSHLSPRQMRHWCNQILLVFLPEHICNHAYMQFYFSKK